MFFAHRPILSSEEETSFELDIYRQVLRVSLEVSLLLGSELPTTSPEVWRANLYRIDVFPICGTSPGNCPCETQTIARARSTISCLLSASNVPGATGKDHKNLARRSMSPLSSRVSHTCAICCGVKLSAGKGANMAPAVYSSFLGRSLLGLNAGVW